jgi:hypothetical protein
MLIGLYVDESVPYFPIEISRTVTGPVASWVFPLSLSTLAIADIGNHTLAWFGILLLAWVPDTHSHLVHMLGVGILGIAFLLTANWKLCAAIWIIRLALKAVAVFVFEEETTSVSSLISHGKRLMYNGRFRDPRTKYVFQITGILQWIVLCVVWMSLFATRAPATQ